MTAQAGSKAHIWKCEIAIPESVAPATKPNHTNAVNLPEVQVVGLQSAERLFEHLRGKRSVATVGADLCHQEDLVAPTFKAQAEPGLSFAAIVFPRIAVKRVARSPALRLKFAKNLDIRRSCVHFRRFR